MLRVKPLWKRGLTLYRSVPEGLGGAVPAIGAEPVDAIVHARSRFRHIARPDRFALYSVHGLHSADGAPPSNRLGDHTLVAVREFRRVPLDASALTLMLFHACPGYAARVVATVAHWVERAVSVYQPAYLLLAHSLEDPGTIALLAGVHQCDALQSARSSAFCIDALLTELRPWLTGEPECYLYCPEDLESSVSPDAV